MPPNVSLDSLFVFVSFYLNTNLNSAHLVMHTRGDGKDVESLGGSVEATFLCELGWCCCRCCLLLFYCSSSVAASSCVSWVGVAAAKNCFVSFWSLSAANFVGR